MRARTRGEAAEKAGEKEQEAGGGRYPTSVVSDRPARHFVCKHNCVIVLNGPKGPRCLGCRWAGGLG